MSKKQKKRRKPRSAKTEGPNSRYWMKKADELFSQQQRSKGGECQICGKQGGMCKNGLEVKGLDLHHLIERGRFKFRYEPRNTLVLCKSNHGSHPNYRNRKISAHGSTDAVERFMEWFKETLPEQHQWYQDNKQDKRPMEGTYRDIWESLQV